MMMRFWRSSSNCKLLNPHYDNNNNNNNRIGLRQKATYKRGGGIGIQAGGGGYGGVRESHNVMSSNYVGPGLHNVMEFFLQQFPKFKSHFRQGQSQKRAKMS
jgi:hypothetical protein